jgi:hypothetical protein
MAKPKLALIPSAQGSKFYSVLPSSGVGDFDFTRSGSATRINSQGLIESVANGVSRLNYPMIDGVVKGCPHHILEPERLQKIQYSEDFSQGYWTKIGSSISQNIIISPDGTQNASKLVEDNLNGLKRLRINAISTSGNNTLSFFVKSAERNWILLREAGQTAAYAYFDLENGVVGQSNLAENIEIKQFNDDWYRISFRDSVTSVAIELRLALSDGVDSYQGDGTSGVYIWGAQVESGSYPTSYIPNYGTAAGVTRSAETANSSGDATTFNDSEGVLIAEISALSDTVSAYNSIGLGNTSAFNRIGLGFKAPSTVYVYKHDGSNSWLRFETIDINSFNKVALSYKTNDNHFWVNGFKLASNTTIEDVSNITELDFQASYGGEKFYGNTKQIQYYDSSLTDNELETLTSWVSFSDMAEGQQYTIE